MAIKKYYDSDCNLGVLDGKTCHRLRQPGPRPFREPGRERRERRRRPAQGLCSLGEGF